MDKDINSFLTKCVRTSLGYSAEEREKFSIIPCFKNFFLREEYDPFEFLRFQLLASSFKENYAGKEDLDASE